MYLVLAAAVVFVVFLHVSAAAGLRKRCWFAANPRCESLDLIDASIPVPARLFWREVSEPLKAIGFTPVACVTSPDLVPQVAAYVAVFENPENQVICVAIATFANVPPAPFRQHYTVGFTTEFTDDFEISTDNSDERSMMFKRPWADGWRFPRLADLSQLYRIHLGLTARRHVTKKTLIADIDRAGRLQAATLRELYGLEAAGYVELARDEQKFRYTWKGAFLAASGHLWPTIAIRRGLAARRSRRLLRELGMPEKYETVDYRQIVNQRMAEELSPVSGIPSARPYFVQAMPAALLPPAEAVRCTVCSRPISGCYYEVDGRILCADCHSSFSPRIYRAFHATLAGLAAGGFAAGIYAVGITLLSPLFLFVIPLVGIIVGAAVRWGAQGRGGWFYRILAVILTYLAIAGSYTAAVMHDLASNPMRQPCAAPEAPAAKQEAVVEKGIERAAREVANRLDTVLASTLPRSLNPVRRWVAVAIFGLILPIQVGIEVPFFMILSGAGLYAAWRINKRRPLHVEGPYAVAATAS